MEKSKKIVLLSFFSYLFAVVVIYLVNNYVSNKYIVASLALLITTLINYIFSILIFSKNRFKLLICSGINVTIFIFLIYLFSMKIQLDNTFSLLVPLFVYVYLEYYGKLKLYDNKYNFKKDYKRLKDRWNKFIGDKRVLPQNIFIFLFFCICIIYVILFYRSNNDSILYSNVSFGENIGPFINDTYKIDFDDISVSNDPNKICVAVGTYTRKIDSLLKFSLYHNDEMVFNKDVNTKGIKDGTFYCLNVGNIDRDEINEYTLEVTSKNKDQNSYITLFKDKDLKSPALIFKRGRSILSIKNFIIVILGLLLFKYISIINNNKEIDANKFIMYIFPILFMILIITPPLENPDEPSHFYSAYNLSQNGFDGDTKNTLFVPENYECLNYSGIQNRDRVNSFDDVKRCLASKDNIKVSNMFGVSNYVYGSFVGHIPQAIFIKIADFFTNSPLIIFYAAKVGNLVCALLLLYIAVKIAPVGKNVLLFIGLLPMTIQQMTSVSYDALLNSVILLFFAFIIRECKDDNKISFKNLIIPILSLVVILMVKIVYAFLGLALLIIPSEKFKNKKSKIIYIFFAFICSYLIYYVINNVLLVSIGDGSGINQRQIDYILNNPLKLIPIAVNTIKMNWLFYIKGIVGYFSWFRFNLGDLIVFSSLVFLIIMSMNTENVLKNKSRKIFLLLLVLLSCAGVFGSMYFCWSKYKLNYVDGVQGRYFISLLPAVSMLLFSKRKKFKIKNNDVLVFLSILIFTYLMYAVIFYY